VLTFHTNLLKSPHFEISTSRQLVVNSKCRRQLPTEDRTFGVHVFLTASNLATAQGARIFNGFSWTQSQHDYMRTCARPTLMNIDTIWVSLLFIPYLNRHVSPHLPRIARGVTPHRRCYRPTVCRLISTDRSWFISPQRCCLKHSLSPRLLPPHSTVSILDSSPYLSTAPVERLA
jgi:hypothetical protein